MSAPRRLLVILLALGACASPPRPIPPEQLAAARAAAEPGARARCTTLGFTDTTSPPAAFCVENAVLERLQQEFGWPRLEASGLSTLGPARSVAIARCIATRVMPGNADMPACIQAQTELVVREDALQLQQLEAQWATAAAAARAANAANAAALRPRVCNRVGNTVVCS